MELARLKIKMERCHRELMPIFQADMPVAFLFPNIETMVVSRYVRGLTSPYRSDPVRCAATARDGDPRRAQVRRFA